MLAQLKMENLLWRVSIPHIGEEPPPGVYKFLLVVDHHIGAVAQYAELVDAEQVLLMA